MRPEKGAMLSFMVFRSFRNLRRFCTFPIKTQSRMTSACVQYNRVTIYTLPSDVAICLVVLTIKATDTVLNDC